MQELIFTAISTLGFPIGMCIIMCWYVKDTTDKHREEIKYLNEVHRGEMNDVTTALNNNTLALQSLCEKLG